MTAWQDDELLAFWCDVLVTEMAGCGKVFPEFWLATASGGRHAWLLGCDEVDFRRGIDEMTYNRGVVV